MESTSEDSLIGNTLLEAASKGHYRCLEFLINKGADVNETGPSGMTVLMYAAHYGHVNCVDLLIKAGADVNGADPNRGTVLMNAARKVHINCIKGVTPLMYAIQNDHTQCTDFLIK